MKNSILQKDAKITNYFDHDVINSLVGSHIKGEKNRRLFIWSLLNFESYLELYGNH